MGSTKIYQTPLVNFLKSDLTFQSVAQVANLMGKLQTRRELKLSGGSWKAADRRARGGKRRRVRFIGSEILRGGLQLELSQSRGGGAVMRCTNTHTCIKECVCALLFMHTVVC